MKKTINSPPPTIFPSDERFKPIEIIILLLLLGIVIICVDIFFYSTTLEDAYITFRYSEHFAEGYGFGSWNKSGERVEGYTSILWMLLLSGAHALGIDVRTAAKITGILIHLVLCSTLIIFPILRRKEETTGNDIFSSPYETVLTGVFLAFYLPISWYATSGMETVLFTALTGLIFLSIFLRKSEILVPLLSFLLVITRPEGLVISAAAIVLYFLVSQREERRLLGVYLSAGVVFLSTVLLTTYRIVIFGELVPNTYWAKAGGASLRHIYWGCRYVAQWIADHQIIVFLIGLGIFSIFFSLWGRKYRNWPIGFITILALVLIYSAYIIKVGGDKFSAFPYWRHFLHIMIPITYLVSFVVVRIFPKLRYFHLFLMLGITFITNLSVVRAHDYSLLNAIQQSLSSFPNFDHAEHSEYLIQLKKISQPNTTIASSLGGELPYVVDAIHIDSLGLNTRYIAKNGTFDPHGAQDSKTDMVWVLEQRPDIIEGYIPGSLIIDADPHDIVSYLERNIRSKMIDEMLSSPIFQNEYCFVHNWPYDSLDRGLFIREDFLNTLDHPEELECIPVANTLLSRATQ